MAPNENLLKAIEIAVRHRVSKFELKKNNWWTRFRLKKAVKRYFKELKNGKQKKH